MWPRGRLIVTHMRAAIERQPKTRIRAALDSALFAPTHPTCRSPPETMPAAPAAPPTHTGHGRDSGSTSGSGTHLVLGIDVDTRRGQQQRRHGGVARECGLYQRRAPALHGAAGEGWAVSAAMRRRAGGVGAGKGTAGRGGAVRLRKARVCG